MTVHASATVVASATAVVVVCVCVRESENETDMELASVYFEVGQEVLQHPSGLTKFISIPKTRKMCK